MLTRRHPIKRASSLSVFCEKYPGLGLNRPFYTSMAMGDPLRDPKPQLILPNCGILLFSKLCDKYTTSKVSSHQNNILSVIFFVKSTLVLVFLGHITHPWPWETPSRIQNYNPYHQTMTFFLSLSFLLISVWNWFLNKSIMDGPTDKPKTGRQTNRQTDRLTDGRSQ